jgi:quinol monooxygenase YgiN
MSDNTVKLGYLIRLQARPGQEAATADFLQSVLPIVEGEPGTTAFFALRLGPSEYGIFNAFPNEASRQAHGGGQAGAALSARAGELFETPPAVQPVDVLVSKLPG